MSKIMCPLVDQEVETIDCLENTDIIDGFISDESHIPDIFKVKKDYKDICKKCPNHVSTIEINEPEGTDNK